MTRFHSWLGLCHAKAASALDGALTHLRSERGQGTVEYVGLILLVSLMMVGVVAAVKGLNLDEGKKIAETVVSKIRQAVEQVKFGK